MLQNFCNRCHSDPAIAGEESRSGNKGLARFLVVPRGGTPRNDGFFSILLRSIQHTELAFLELQRSI
jgi:hypothetical protein